MRPSIFYTHFNARRHVVGGYRVWWDGYHGTAYTVNSGFGRYIMRSYDGYDAHKMHGTSFDAMTDQYISIP